VARAAALRGVPGSLEFKTWDGSRLPCPTRFFKTAVAILTLDWCSTPAAMLGELNRTLQPGGDLYLLERDASAARFPDGFTSLLAMLPAAGFRDGGTPIRREIALGGEQHATAVIIHAQTVSPVSAVQRRRATDAPWPDPSR
jgi:hypothetical protein